LPEDDAALIEAERRFHEGELRAKALHREFGITVEIEAEVFNPIVAPARDGQRAGLLN
jgi:hypothetical protein